MKLKAYKGRIVCDVIALGRTADEAKENAGWAMAVDPLGPNDAMATGVTYRAIGSFVRSPDDDYEDDCDEHAMVPPRPTKKRPRYYLAQESPLCFAIRDRHAGNRTVCEYSHGDRSRIHEALQNAQRELARLNGEIAR